MMDIKFVEETMFRLFCTTFILLSIVSLNFAAKLPQNHGVDDYNYLKEQYPAQDEKTLKSYAEKLTRGLNSDINPCENFVNFINGPEFPRTLDDVLSTLLLNNTKDMYKDIFESKPEDELTNDEFKMKLFFNSCKKVSESGQSFYDFLGESRRPLFNLDWVEAQAYMQHLGYFSIIRGSVIDYNRAEGKFYYEILPSYLEEFGIFAEDEKTNGTELMLRHFKIDEEEIPQFKEELISLELKYREMAKSLVQVHSKTVYSNLEQLEANIPGFNWKNFLCTLTGESLEVDNKNMVIVVKNEDILRKFIDFSSGTNKTIFNCYQLFHVMDKTKSVYTRITEKPEECYTLVKEYFPRVYDSMLLSLAIDEYEFINFENVFHSLKFINDYDNLPDEKVRSYLNSEYESYENLFTKWKSSWKFINGNEYENIDINGENRYLTNEIALLYHNAAYRINKLQKNDKIKELLEYLYLFSAKPRLYGISKFLISKFHEALKLTRTTILETNSNCASYEKTQIYFESVKMAFGYLKDLMESKKAESLNLDHKKYEEILSKSNLNWKKIFFVTAIERGNRESLDHKQFNNHLLDIPDFVDEYNCDPVEHRSGVNVEGCN